MYLERLAQIESGNNPNAASPASSARGLYQFTNATGAQYGITDPYDVEQQNDAVQKLTADNYNALKGALGREPTEGELYLAHQQGANGALKLLSNPSARAVDVVGANAVINNGGSQDMTAGDFANQWINKFEQGAGQQDLSGVSNEELMKAAGLDSTSQQENAPDLSSVSNDDLLKAAGIEQPVQQEQVPQEKTDIGGLLEDWQGRANKQQDILQSTDNPLSKALQVVGNVGAATGDVWGAGYRGLMNMAPESAKRGEEALKNLIMPPAKMVGKAVSPALAPLFDAAKNHPEAVRNVDALIGLSQLIPSARAAVDTAQFAGDVAAMAGRGAKKTALSMLAPDIEGATAKLAAQAGEMGIPIRLDQAAPSRVRSTVQKISQEIPFSGVQSFENKQVSSWNRALAQKTIGKDSLSPENIKSFLKETSQKYDDILKGEKLSVSSADIKRIDDIYADADLTMTGDLKNIVAKNIAKFKDDIGTGVVDGEKMASFRSRLINRMPSAPGEVRKQLGDIVKVVDDITDGSISAKKIAELKDVRRQWRNFRTVEPLLEKSPEGVVEPTQLMQRVASSPYIKASRSSIGEDDLVDLARIGKDFMVKKGGSDTFQKGALTGGALLTLANPSAAVLPVSGVFLNRAYQKLYNESPALLKFALEKGLK